MKFKGWFFGKMFVTNVTFIFCNFLVLVIHEQILCCDWLLNCYCIQCWFLFNCWKFWNHHHLILGCFEYTIDNSAHLRTTDYTTIGWNRRLNKILDIVVIYLIVMRIILRCYRWSYRPIWVLKIFVNLRMLTYTLAHAKVKKSIFNSKILELVGNIDIILIRIQSLFNSKCRFE